MKIKREINGQEMEFELTSDELYSAYIEKEHEYDRADVINKLENYYNGNKKEFEDDYELPLDAVINNDDLIDEIAYQKRRNQDKYDMDWVSARDDAFAEILSDFKADYAYDFEERGLPDMCYNILPSTGEVIIIARGETGYRKTSFENIDEKVNQETVDEANRKLCVNKAQAAAMLVGSLYGWDVPGANPANYDANGKPIPFEKQPVNMKYSEMVGFFRKVERTKAEHVVGYIVFTEDSYTASYTEEQRTYVVSSDNKAFQPNMGGYSIYGSCMDGTDINVRLEQYMAAEYAGKDGWKVERCFMTREEINKGNVALLNSEKAVAIEYKGIVFDNWSVDKDNNTVYAEICQDCVDKHRDVLSEDEIDDDGAVGACSVSGCNVVGVESEKNHYYIDFKPELIHVLDEQQLRNLENGGALADRINAASKQVDSTSAKSTPAPPER